MKINGEKKKEKERKYILPLVARVDFEPKENECRSE